MNIKTVTILLFTLGICSAFFGATSRQMIVQLGFGAFARGTLGNSGENLYISQNGRIQTINQWDLNADGYNDVLIANDHDAFETVDAFVYWNSSKGFASFCPIYGGRVRWRRSSSMR